MNCPGCGKELILENYHRPHKTVLFERDSEEYKEHSGKNCPGRIALRIVEKLEDRLTGLSKRK